MTVRVHLVGIVAMHSHDGLCAFIASVWMIDCGICGLQVSAQAKAMETKGTVWYAVTKGTLEEIMVRSL